MMVEIVVAVELTHSVAVAVAVVLEESVAIVGQQMVLTSY
tara:strand:+ start:138 stop:257 length:120 start_codon:yes stop_codon:yes gene_type:complete